ncbi:glycogen synthase [Longilinea arvoryzae]|uniref:Glycogen synthase n=1 Tax=Longilinea arvoryzae TaxID=360412 RepID=A0A0S7BBJ2_9CHLR|nr:glycogen synthase [Longilinea arvoryzae]
MIKVGGLGDVAGSLPYALRSLPGDLLGGHSLDVRLVIPYHGEVARKLLDPQPVASFIVQHPSGPIPTRAYVTYISNVPVYMIEGAPIGTETPVYSGDNYIDGVKYTYFSQAAVEMARQLNWRPDILHANDWHTALSVFYLARNRLSRDPFFAQTRSVLTIHNLPFMGAGAERALAEFDIQPVRDLRLPIWARQFPLPLGMLAADRIVAVSPTYAREILTPEFGCGLQDFLISRSSIVSGILNGLDQESWDPEQDSLIASNFTAANLESRENNKKSILDEFDLSYDPKIPLLILISRMDPQKGVDLAVDSLTQMTHVPWQAILLGTGDPILESACRSLQLQFPDRVRAVIRFDTRLSRRLYAGGDLLLMPSRYEPCGLAQMIGMRYGCVPLARATGGLRDTIFENSDEHPKNGFLFEEIKTDAMNAALQRALSQYSDRALWRQYQINGMQQDFSWKKSALEYANLYINLWENQR